MTITIPSFSGFTDNAPASPSYFNSKFSEVYTSLTTLASALPDFYVSKYGATGDGSTNDRTAILNAMSDASNAGGGRVIFESGKTYNLGATVTNIVGDFENIGSSLNVHLPLQNTANIWLDMRGATLKTTATNGAVILLDGCQNVAITDPRFVGTYANDTDGFTEVTTGPGAVVLAALTRDCRRIDIDRMTCRDIFFGVASGGSPTKGPRVSQVGIQNLSVFTGRYGIQCGEDGDDYRVSNLYCDNVKRSYFVYGVERHTVDLTSVGGKVFNAVLLKAYVRDTHDINLTSRISGRAAIADKMRFESQHTVSSQGTPARIYNVTVDYNDLGSTNNSGGTPAHGIGFGYYRDSVLTSGSTFNLFDNITIRGISYGVLAHSTETPVLQSPVGRADFSGLSLPFGGNTVAQAMDLWGFTPLYYGNQQVEGRLTAGGISASGSKNAIGTSSAASDRALALGGTPSEGTIQYGVVAEYRGSSAATGLIVGHYLRAGTTPANYAVLDVQGFRLANPALGSGSTITNATALYIEDITVGQTTNLVIDSVGTAPSRFSGRVDATAFGFRSETSLHWTRSGVSTIAPSYGTVDFALNGVRLSLRSLDMASLTSANIAVNEVCFAIGASGCSLAYRSNGTMWYPNSSLSTVG